MSYLELEKKYQAQSKALHQDGGEAMAAFRGLVKASMAEGVLDRRTKELIALAIAVAVRCEGCIVYHARACVRSGVGRAELLDMLGVAVEMGGGPSAVHGATALACYDEMVAAG